VRAADDEAERLSRNKRSPAQHTPALRATPLVRGDFKTAFRSRHISILIPL